MERIRYDSTTVKKKKEAPLRNESDCRPATFSRVILNLPTMHSTSEANKFFLYLQCSLLFLPRYLSETRLL